MHTLIVLCLALGACDTNEGTIACPQSLSDYCATAPCVAHIDRNNTVPSFCDSIPNPPPNVQLRLWGCDDGGIGIVESSIGTFQYDADGNLVAVTRLTPGGDPFYSCIAGPTRFTPAQTCLTGLVSFLCANHDSGVD